MNNTQLPGLCESVPSFTKYLRNWCSKGVLSLDIIIYEVNPDLQNMKLLRVLLGNKWWYLIIFFGVTVFLVKFERMSSGITKYREMPLKSWNVMEYVVSETKTKTRKTSLMRAFNFQA